MRHAGELDEKIRNIRKNPGDSAHDLRVLIKILRAGNRFFDPKLRTTRRLDRSLRALSHSLEKQRDQEARHEIAAWLGTKSITAKPSAPKAGIEIAARKILASAAVLLPEMEGREQKGKLSKRPLKKALKEYWRNPGMPTLHKLRQRVKRLAYQLRYFSSKRDARKIGYQDLNKAGKELGKALDIAKLDGGKAKNRKKLRQASESQKDKALSRLRTLGL
jgi:CHAD domain-containing protein